MRYQKKTRVNLKKEFEAGNQEQCLRQNMVIPDQVGGLTMFGQPPQNDREISPHGRPHPGKHKSI